MTVPVEPVVRWVAGLFFALMLVCVCVTDVRYRRIRNTHVLWLAAGGFLYSLASRGGLPGVTFALGGLLVGFFVWVVFHVLGMLGAGDVKFFAAAGTWLGAAATLDASLATAVLGGAFALVWMVREYGWSLASMRLAHGIRQPRVFAEPVADRPTVRRRLPYGVPMAIGIAVVAWTRHLFW